MLQGWWTPCGISECLLASERKPRRSGARASVGDERSLTTGSVRPQAVIRAPELVSPNADGQNSPVKPLAIGA